MSLAEKKIMKILEESGKYYELHEHEPVFTCEQASKVRGIERNKGIKCMLLKIDNGFVLAVTRGDRRLNLNKIAFMENVKKMRFANDEEIEKIAECRKGCVHPFCNCRKYIDRVLLDLEEVEFNPGSHEKSIRMKFSDLLELLENKKVEDIGISK